MRYLKNNYFVYLLALLVVLAHQIIFQDFFPNKNLLLGHDYSQFIPNFIFGKIWFNNNFLSIPWFTPSFCCGIPFFGDPQTMYYSFQQLIFLLFSPLLSLKIMFLFFSLVGFFGTFFLLNKSFNKNIYISLIAASLFLFNGFINYRAVIGHVTLLSYAFIPLYCYFLIHAFENREDKLKSIFYILISSLIFANFIHSGSGPILLIIILSIFFILSIYIYLNEKFTIINYLILSFIIGLFIASSKINAALSFLSNFPRENVPIVFEGYYEFFTNLFKSLFFYPDINKFNFEIINSVTGSLGVHEIEFGITILPLIIFVIFLANIKKIRFNKLNSKKLIALLFILLITIVIISMNVFGNELGTLFHKLPVVKSTWKHFILAAAYILPIIIISCLLVDKINLSEKNIKIFTACCLLIIILQNYIYNKDFYYKQNYNPADFEKFYQDKEKIQNIKIEKGALFLDKEGKLISDMQRNNMFLDELSPLFCYQAMFGYKFNLPRKKLIFNEKNEINENLFLITNDPKLINNDELNFFNPSCFIFPNENNCQPGDLFKKDQIKELDQFLNYKTFEFKMSKSQKITNYLSIISLIISMIYIIYYLIKRLIFKNNV